MTAYRNESMPLSTKGVYEALRMTVGQGRSARVHGLKLTRIRGDEAAQSL
jgi:hypothetical protein